MAKQKDIEASVNTFFASLASNFDMSGYGKDVLQTYIPAVVYTMYDGYYVYSPYTNKLDEGTTANIKSDATYKNNETVTGLKPYVYYSCRYKRGTKDDFVITYSLDSYIRIQGKVNNDYVDEAGYLLTNVGVGHNGPTYNNVIIGNENELKEKVHYIDNNSIACTLSPINCKKVNGVKYYKAGSSSDVFSVKNNKKIIQKGVTLSGLNDQALQFYQKAYEFKNKIRELGIDDLSTRYAVDVGGNYYTSQREIEIFAELFDNSGKSIEDEDSNFNVHRLDVIKHCIESNLSVAISNYNKVSSASVNFQMPRLKDAEWEKVLNNVSMITFLQGLNIGGKIYNGYAIVPNYKTEEFVSEDSIYVLTSDYVYHKIYESGMNLSGAVGILNVNTERKMLQYKRANSDNIETDYYYPINALGSYNSIVYTNTEVKGDISQFEYVKNYGNYDLKKLYYTALGRERYSMFRSNNPFK